MVPTHPLFFLSGERGGALGASGYQTHRLGENALVELSVNSALLLLFIIVIRQTCLVVLWYNTRLLPHFGIQYVM